MLLKILGYERICEQGGASNSNAFFLLNRSNFGQLITALHEMNHTLIELGHAGLFVRLWDNDIITTANWGRQRFAECEVGLYKSAAIINRINRWASTNWKAETRKFEKDGMDRLPDHSGATIYISCVDTVKARFEIADILGKLNNSCLF